MRYANIYIYIFVLHRGFFQQPRGRVAPRLGSVPPIRQINWNLFVVLRAVIDFHQMSDNEGEGAKHHGNDEKVEITDSLL